MTCRQCSGGADGQDSDGTAEVPPDATLLLAAVKANGDAILIVSAKLEEPGTQIA